MIKVENIFPSYEKQEERRERIQEAYTGIQKMFYNEKNRTKQVKGNKKNV